MQVPSYWRMKTQRYRLTGVRYDNGQVSVIERPIPEQPSEKPETAAVKQPAA